MMCLGNFVFTQAETPPSSELLARLWRAYIEPYIEQFGADRRKVPSNFPVDEAGLGSGTVWNIFERIAAGCSADEKRMLFSGTAKRIQRMN